MKFIILILLGLCLVPNAANASLLKFRPATNREALATMMPDSRASRAVGTNFVFSFVNSHLYGNDTSYTETLSVTLTNPTATDANVAITSQFPGFNTINVVVSAGKSAEVPITPVTIQADYQDKILGRYDIETKSLWITSSAAISVVATNSHSDGGSEDKYAIFPLCQLGTRYVIVSDESIRATGNLDSTNVFTVIATMDNTKLTFMGINLIGLPTLMKGQQATLATPIPLSAIIVTANNPIAVIAGAVCGFGYYNQGVCSHEAIMLYPTTSYGKYIPTLKFPPEDYEELTILVQDNGTTLSIDNQKIDVVNQLQFYLIQARIGALISADKPISVVSVGSTNLAGDSAPFFVNVPSIDNFDNSTDGTVTFATGLPPDTAMVLKNYVRLTTLIDNIGKIAIDGYFPNGLIYQRMGQSNYYSVDVAINAGQHTVSATGNVKFSVTVFGYGPRRAYGFVAGVDLPANGAC